MPRTKKGAGSAESREELRQAGGRERAEAKQMKWWGRGKAAPWRPDEITRLQAALAGRSSKSIARPHSPRPFG